MPKAPLLYALSIVAAIFASAGCSSTHDRANAPGAPGLLAPTPHDPAAAEFEVHPARAAWNFHGTEGVQLASPHYRLYTTGRFDWMQDYAIDFAEQALHFYRTSLGDLPAPARPLEIYLFADRAEWRAYTRSLMKDHADLYLGLGRGGYSTRGIAVVYDIGFEDTFAILSHEGWHQYTQVAFKHPLPTWLEEGIATYMEGRRQVPGQRVEFRPWANPQRLAALRNASDLITLAELVDRSPQHFLEDGSENLLTYYAQVWALAQFLVHGEDGRYRDGLRRLLEDAAEGRVVSTILTTLDVPSAERRRMAVSNFGPGVILAYFNPSFSEFADQYLEFVDRLVADGKVPRAEGSE